MKKKQGVTENSNEAKLKALAVGLLVASLVITGCSLLPRDGVVEPIPEPVEETQEVEVEEILGWVSEMNLDTGLLAFDDLEWITLEDTERIEELGLDGDFPNGFYLHNEVERVERLPVSEEATVWLLNWEDLANPVKTDVQALSDFLDQRNSLFRLTTENGVIVDVFEVYTP